MKKTMILILAALSAIHCASGPAIPPKTDLSGFNRIGIVEFAVKNARGVLDEMATERLARHLKEYYRKAEFVLLKNPPDTFGEQPAELSQAVRKIASENNLQALFLGEISVSDFRPDTKKVRLMTRSRIGMKFRMSAELRLYSGKSGSEIWKGDSTREGHASYDHFSTNINPDFHVSDKDESYVRFVRDLIYHLTEDLRPRKKS